MAEWRKVQGGRASRPNKPVRANYRHMTPAALSHLMANPDVQVRADAKNKRPGQWVCMVRYPETMHNEYVSGRTIGVVPIENEELVKQLAIYRIIYENYFGLLGHLYLEYANLPAGKWAVNIQKEFDDAISNTVISEGFDKLVSLFQGRYGYTPTANFELWKNSAHQIPRGSEVQIVEMKGKSYGLRYRYEDGVVLSIASFGSRMAYLLDLGADYGDAVICLLLAYNGRFNSGSNWSPIESYPDLYDAKYANHIKVECFASGWNCQNCFQYLDNGMKVPEKPIVDYILTRYPEQDRKIFPNVVGTWPVTCWEILEANFGTAESREGSSTKFYLMVNPIYTEPAVRLAIEEMHAMWTKYGDALAFRCTFPLWPDIIETGSHAKMMEDMGMDVVARSESTVRNFLDRKKIGLRFYIASLN